MKKFIVWALVATIGCAVISCHTSTEEDGPNGTGIPIELSQDKVHFRSNGGEITIYCLNYSSWKIEILVECSQDGEEDIEHVVKFSGDWAHQEAAFDGIKLWVDDVDTKDNQTSVKIIVEPYSTVRRWKLYMSHVNVSTSIEITQN